MKNFSAEDTTKELEKWHLYYEKKSGNYTDAQLKNKNYAKGAGNYTWFWRYLQQHGLCGNMQGEPWCQALMVYIFAILGGDDAPKKCLGGVTYSTIEQITLAKKAGQWVSKYGQLSVGDLAMFKHSSTTGHVEMVYKFNDTYIWTIGGNTSDDSYNREGNCVGKHKMLRSKSTLQGYVRPLYSGRVKASRGMTGKYVKEAQELLVKKGFSVGKTGIDGDFGNNTVKAVQAAQKALGLSQSGLMNKETYNALLKYEPKKTTTTESSTPSKAEETFKVLKKGDIGVTIKALQELLLTKGFNVGSCGADGEFGSDTEKAIKEVQKKAGLTQSGKYDKATYEALIKMKDSVFQVYGLTDSQIRKITSLCIQEQGSSKAGIMWEASQMCNLWESKSSTTKKKYDNSIYKYIRNSGWYAKAATYMDKENGSAAQREHVKEVMCKGLRRLPLCVDEHDCGSDLISKPSNPVRGKTKIKNRYGSTYTYFGKSACGDWFGAINYKFGQPYYTTDGKLTTN